MSEFTTQCETFENGCYLIDRDEIVGYDMMCSDEHLAKHLSDSRQKYLGKGYKCNTTLSGDVSSFSEISHFFVWKK